jgi:hypothetical protein
VLLFTSNEETAATTQEGRHDDRIENTPERVAFRTFSGGSSGPDALW